MIIHNLENLKKIKRIDELELDGTPIKLEPKLELNGFALATKGKVEPSTILNQTIYVYVIPKNTHRVSISNVLVAPLFFRRYTWDVSAFFEKTGDQSDFSDYEYIPHGAYSIERYVRQTHDDSRPLSIQMDYCRHFSWENDKTYCIAVSSKITPTVQAITYKTEGELYFDEDPVAEAIFDGDKLYESRIMCEKVVDDGLVIKKGFFLWNDEKKIVHSHGNDYVLREAVYFKPERRELAGLDRVQFFRDPKNYRISKKREFIKRLQGCKIVGKCNICVPVFPKIDKRFGSYVWSKNVDSDVETIEKNIDLRKDPYNNENLLKYNSHHLYSKLFDGFSLNVLFPDFKSFAETSPADAARIIARNLLRMPKGRRYISIDNGDVLKSLMLGPIYLADKVDDKNNGQARLEKDYLCSMVYFDDEDSNKGKEVSGDVICGDGYFFYDAPIHLDNPKIKNVPEDIKEKYKALLNLLYRNPNVHKDGHDINENISSCEAMRNFLDKIFKAVKTYGVEIDYVFCDFEVFRNTANDLRIQHRLLSTDSVVAESSSALYDRVVSPDADEVLSKNDEQKKKQSNEDEKQKKALFRKNNMWNALWASLKRRKDKEISDGYRDIFNKLKKRGYVITDSDNRLASVAISNVFQYGYLFAPNYAARRNVNIWDQVVLEYIAGLVDKFMMEPIRTYSRRMRCSLNAAEEHKGFVHNTEIFERYLGGNVRLPPAMYSAPNIYMSKSQGIHKRSMDNWIALPDDDSPFANLVGTVNNMRSAVLSNGKKKVWPIVASSYYWVWKTFTSQKSMASIFDENGKIKLDAENLASVCNEEKNAQFAARSHKYYREMLIHSWLCNPENMSAYLHFHDHGFSVTKTDHYVFKPSDDGLTASFGQIYQEEFNQNAYKCIQSVVSEIQTITKKYPMKPLVSTLASETNPFLLTGVRIGRIRLYRFTVNDNVDVDFLPSEPLPFKPFSFKLNNILRLPVSKLRDLEFVLGEKKVLFRDALLLDCCMSKGRLSKNGPKGFWIAMPWFVAPKITTDYRFYQNNPSFDVNIGEVDTNDRVMGRLFTKSSGVTQLKWPGIVSVFGECARKQKMMTCVHFDSNDEEKTVLGVKFKPKGRFDTEKEYVFERSFDLDSPRDANGCVYAPLVSNKCVILGSLKVCYEDHPSPDGVVRELDKPLETLDICCGSSDSVSWYKSYIQGMNFRVDVFRESDGVNISRVNRACNEAYANLPVDTSCDDFLRLRVSWLNATEHLQHYKVICAPRFEKTIRFPLKLFSRSYKIPAGSEKYKLYKIGRAGSFGSFLDVYIEQNGNRELVYSIPINRR